MIVSLPQMRALGMGAPTDDRERAAWVRQTVGLFLEGFGKSAGSRA